MDTSSYSHPDLSIDDFIKLVKNFIDMLVLASGYQSTGRLAHWDSQNIKRCFEWATFIEKVSKCVTSLSDYEDYVNELDAALLELTSASSFPRVMFILGSEVTRFTIFLSNYKCRNQCCFLSHLFLKQGFAHLLCRTLGRARDLLLERLIQTFPLRDSHLRAIVRASVEMDISKLQTIDYNPMNLYLERLMRIPSDGKKSSEERNILEDSSPDAFLSRNHVDIIKNEFSELAIQQLMERQSAVSSTSDLEKGLETLRNTLERSMNDEIGPASKTEPEKHPASLLTEELPVDLLVWDRWKLRSISYMLGKRTMRLVSSASLIFSESEAQWAQVFKRINNPSDNGASVGETIELLLLGCIIDRWSTTIKQLMSVTYESLTISKLYDEVFNSPLTKSLNLFVKEGLTNSKERSIMHYLEILLDGQTNHLWMLSPVLAAVAIPVWSQMFRSYLHELESHFRGYITRCCTCVTDKIGHRECEVVERIWCVYIFHNRRYLTASGTTTHECTGVS